MRTADLETWITSVCDQVVKGRPAEDQRVELKREWIDPRKAARRLAGHCNSVAGESVLWIIGVDEDKRSIVGAQSKNLADWYPQLASEFDAHPPTLITPLNVRYEGETVVGLLFEADRVPYVIKNRQPANSSSGPATLEVPYREGTGTRSARHEDLLRILIPRARLPILEIVRGSLSLSPGQTHELRLDIYCMPQTGDEIGLSDHRMTIELFNATEYAQMGPERLLALEAHGFTFRLDGQSAYRSLTFRGPRLVAIEGKLNVNIESALGGLGMRLSLFPALATNSTQVEAILVRSSHQHEFNIANHRTV